MVESSNQRNMNIDLHIKSLTIKVSMHTALYVVWQRGTYPSSIVAYINRPKLVLNFMYRQQEGED